MTTIHSAMARFLTQNERNPFHANGPLSVNPAKPAGTSATATRMLNSPSHRGNTGSSWSSK